MEGIGESGPVIDFLQLRSDIVMLFEFQTNV